MFNITVTCGYDSGEYGHRSITIQTSVLMPENLQKEGKAILTTIDRLLFDLDVTEADLKDAGL